MKAITCCCAPAPIESMATTAATPKIMPSIVSSVRSLWSRRLSTLRPMSGSQRTVVIERRSAEGEPQRAPAIFAELVSRGVDVIAMGGSRWLREAAQQATRTIPTVSLFDADPVAEGLVPIIQRNVTDAAAYACEMIYRDGIAQLVARRWIDRPFLSKAIRPIMTDPLPLKSLYVLHHAVILVVGFFDEKAVVLDDGLVVPCTVGGLCVLRGASP